MGFYTGLLIRRTFWRLIIADMYVRGAIAKGGIVKFGMVFSGIKNWKLPIHTTQSQGTMSKLPLNQITKH